MRVHEKIASERCYQKIIEGFLRDFHCGVHVFCAAKEIIFTRNATEAINLVARTWGAANISLLGGWLFVCIQKKWGGQKNVEDLRLSQGLVMRFCSRLWTGKTWGPTIWMFQHLKFWILESFDHFNQFCLKGLSACSMTQQLQSDSCIFDWPGTSFQFGAMATARRVKRSQAEIWTFAEQWHPGALDFKSVFVTVHEIHDAWQPKDIEHFENLINERMVRRLRECFLKQWNTETVAVSVFHRLVLQNPQISDAS